MRPPAETCWKMAYVTILTISLSVPVFSEHNSCGAKVSFCPVDQNVTSALAFVDKYPEQPMLQVITCFYLSCCIGNNPHVNSSWYKWIQGQSDGYWERQTATAKGCKEEGCYRYTSDNRQTLIFPRPDIDFDSGPYRCVATDGRTTISRTFDVRVVGCKKNPDHITFVWPSNPEASLDGTFTQDCTGDFGCFGAVENNSLAWWSYLDENGRLTNLTVGKHGRYEVHENISWDETKKSSVLTIKGVQKEDFSRTFLCQLQMRNLATYGFNISLTETDSRTTWRKYIPVIVTMSVFMGVMLMAVLLTYRFCSPVVSFWVKSASGRLPKRESRHTHDVMLVSREDAENECDDKNDTRVLRSLQDALVDKDYQVLNVHETLAGRRLQRYDNVQNCVTVIFVICTDSLKEEKDKYLEGIDFFFSNAAAEKTNMIFVSTKPMTGQEWASLSKDYKSVYPHAPKLCTVVTWPGDAGQSSRLRQANFWCQVQRFLPKPSLQGDRQPGDTGPSRV